MQETSSKFASPKHLLLLLVLGILVVLYLPTLQRIINGSSELKMIDVGETQAVLNTWGSLHATGYPLYVVSGNLLVTVLRDGLGIGAATAASSVSLIWALLALSLLYALIYHLTGRAVLAASVTFAYGLTRFFWIHAVIAEIYSFTFLFLLVLFTVALWQRPLRYRILILAILGGFAVAHYRTLGFTAFALIFATFPEVLATLRKPRYLALCILGIGLGVLPYVYLPIAANSDSRWVYGSPDTWQAFKDQVTAKEAEHFLHLPENDAQFTANRTRMNNIIVDELGVVGVVLGFIGLGVGLATRKHRKTAITFILAAIPAYGFAVLLYYDVLALLVLNITLMLVMGWVFLADNLWDWGNTARTRYIVSLPTRHVVFWTRHAMSLLLRTRHAVSLLLILMAGLYGVWLHGQNYDFIYNLTNDSTGLDTIALAENAPADSTLMLAWGPRYFAVGFAQDVEGQLSHIRRADHNADFPQIIERGALITPEYTLYAQDVAWWQSKLGKPVYLQGAAPQLIEITTERTLLNEAELAEIPTPTDDIPVIVYQSEVTCTDSLFVIDIRWVARTQPERNFSVLMHLLDANGVLLANDDKFAPVFGRRPMNEWLAGEVVRDVYSLPRLSNAKTIEFGLYEQLSDGSFQNYNVLTYPAECLQ